MAKCHPHAHAKPVESRLAGAADASVGDVYGSQQSPGRDKTSTAAAEATRIVPAHEKHTRSWRGPCMSGTAVEVRVTNCSESRARREQALAT